jgi:hypothetical protein
VTVSQTTCQQTKTNFQMNTAPEIRNLPLSDLENAEYNPRLMAAGAMQGLRQSLSAYGVLELPVVNIQDGKMRIISGHQRVQAMREEGVTDIDCVVVEFDEATEMAANITMNNPAIQGTYDPIQVLPTLREIEADLPHADMMGFEETAAGLRKKADRLQVGSRRLAVDDVDKAPTVIESQVGTVYQLGEHRLFCGDLRDVPLEFFPEQGFHATVTQIPDLKKEDHSQWLICLEAFLSRVLDMTFGPCYLFVGKEDWLPFCETAWESAGGALHRWLVWGYASGERPVSDYRNQLTFVMYGARAGEKIQPPKNRRGNVVIHPKVGDATPVSLVRDLLEDSTEVGDAVLDLRAGVGTTLVVGEETGRICYACEASPRLCDMIRRRWAAQKYDDATDWAEKTPSILSAV